MTGLWFNGAWATSVNCPADALNAFVGDALTPRANYPGTGIIRFEPFYDFFKANDVATCNHKYI